MTNRRRTVTFLAPTLRQPAPELGPRARRTIDRILAATKAVFLERGYGGTSIDEIARRAGTSRASFYTYFPSKRDALLALGTDANRHAQDLIEELASVQTARGIEAIGEWVDRYFAFLDEYGSFALAWQQAAARDEELRLAGTKYHLRTCRHLGETLDALRGRPLGDPTSQGLLVFSMMERAWSHCHLYGEALDRQAVCANIVIVIAALLSTAGRAR